ncbi:MAG: hypothetical protein LBK53_01890 [Heliobacteriaceae bacterium]|nr:hypothetical protein [Heliobacteriaceae bacterium]
MIRHCERSEAIQSKTLNLLDCFVLITFVLAMTSVQNLYFTRNLFNCSTFQPFS